MTSMQTISEIRHERLEMLIAQHGNSIANLNEAIGNARTDATLSQIRTKAKHSKTGTPRSMGDPLARKIEKALSLPNGWMDQPVQHRRKHHGEMEEPRTEYAVGDVEKAITTIERHLETLDDQLKNDALNLLSMYMRIKQPEMKVSLIKMLETGNQQARKAA